MGLPFKGDEDFDRHNSAAFEASAAELRNFVADHESLQSELEDVKRDQKDLFTVMKSKGYNVKVLRRLLAERKRDAGELAEEQEVLGLYREMLR